MPFSKNTFLANIICKLQFVPLSAIQNYSSTGNFQKQVVADFLELYNTPGSMVFTQVEEKTPSGSLYSQQITLSYPGLMRANPEAFYNIDQHEHLVKFVDNHGQIFIMGSLDAGATMRWQYSSATGGHSIVFSLTDTFPIGHQKELGQFFFDDRGFLMSAYESSETFYFDTKGNLIVSGPNEADYYLQDGQLYINP